jgi:hypothetical protein
VPPSPGRPQRAANTCASSATRPASVSTQNSTSTTRIRHRARARSSSQQRRCSEPCLRPRHPRRVTCIVRCRHSSSRWPCNRPKARHPAYASRAVRGTTAVPRAKWRLSTRAPRRGNQPTRVERWSGSGSLIRTGKPRTAMPAISSTLAERATQKHERRQATTLGGAVATIAEKISHQRRNPREPVYSAGRSAQQAFPSASASPPRSTSTRGIRTLACGSTTTS